ncbi:MAG: glycoside hydrolase family 20 zincin-like fold domain-containing protein [Chloroflexota bacterium]|nr:glycoside hydrolase family 20 zincin-like fold domain-containing protein [Chloroflexota bacterium]
MWGSGGVFSLANRHLIVLSSADPQPLRRGAARLQKTLRERAGVSAEIVASAAVPQAQTIVGVSVMPGATAHLQGYELRIDAAGIFAMASGPAGTFYAIMTLCQLVEQYGRNLPMLRIRDWPDFPTRGVMLDISRDKVPTRADDAILGGHHHGTFGTGTGFAAGHDCPGMGARSGPSF